MIQARLREGGDGRWLNPARDIVNSYPGMLRAALKSFTDFQGDETCTREEMMLAASAVGKTVAHIIKVPTLLEEARKLLWDLEQAHPRAMPKIEKAVLYVLHGNYAAWISEARPKTVDDATIPTIGLDDVSNYFAQEALNPGTGKL